MYKLLLSYPAHKILIELIVPTKPDDNPLFYVKEYQDGALYLTQEFATKQEALDAIQFVLDQLSQPKKEPL